MGLVVLAGINPPHEVISFGETVAGCSGVEKAFLCRSRKDPNVLPPTVLFQEGSGGRFVANFFFGKRKYGIDITPSKNMGTTECGQEVLSCIQNVHAHVAIRGDELFQKVYVPTLARTREEEAMDSRDSTGDGASTVSKTMFPELLVVPPEIWGNPRVLAIYRYIETMLWGNENDSDFVLIDETCGKVHAMVRHLEDAFSASGGTVDDPLRILRGNEVVARELVRDSVGNPWWIFRFVENVPEEIEGEKDPIALWALRSRRPVSSPASAEVSKQGSAVVRMPPWTPKEVRLTAAYHYIAASFLTDASGFEVVDGMHGMIVGLHSKLEQGLDTNPGSVDRVVRSLESSGILKRQEGVVGPNHSLAWIFYFCPDAPPLPEGLTSEELWHSRDKMKGRPLRTAADAPAEAIPGEVSSGDEFVASVTEVSEASTSLASVVEDTFVPETPSAGSAPAPTNITEKIRVLGEARRRIDMELAESAHALVVELEEDIIVRCREAVTGILTHIDAVLEPVTGLLSFADAKRVEDITARLRAFFETPVSELGDEAAREEEEERAVQDDVDTDVAAFLARYKQLPV